MTNVRCIFSNAIAFDQDMGNCSTEDVAECNDFVRGLAIGLLHKPSNGSFFAIF